MPAKINVPSYLSKVLHSKKPLTILALLAVVGAAAWAKGALAATTSPTPQQHDDTGPAPGCWHT